MTILVIVVTSGEERRRLCGSCALLWADRTFDAAPLALTGTSDFDAAVVALKPRRPALAPAGFLCRTARCEWPLLVLGWALPASSSGVSLADSGAAVAGGTAAAGTVAVDKAVAGCCTAVGSVVEEVDALETGAEDEEPEVVSCLGVSVLPDRPCRARGEAVCGLLA